MASSSAGAWTAIWLSGEKPDRFAGGRERRGDGARLGRPAASCGKLSFARRRLREAADHLDNAVEFEGPQGAGVHAIE